MTFLPLCITCMYNRPKVSEVFLTGMKRLGIPVIAAVSDIPSVTVCNKMRTQNFLTDNAPLGNKWNEAAKYALTVEGWTHLIISGDDDLYSNDYRDRLEEFQDHPFVGIESTYMVSPKERHALHFRYNNTVAMGGGRMLKREVVEKMGGVLYDAKQNKSIDHVGDMMLLEHGYLPAIIDTDKTLCVSVKTKQNIWPLSNFTNIAPKIDYEKAVSILPSNERKLIYELQ